MITPYPDHKYGKPAGSIHIFMVLLILAGTVLFKNHFDRQSISVTATDSEIERTLNHAITKVAAREAQLELAIAKHLDLERLREELGARHIPAEPVEPAEEKAGQRLSILPR